MKNTQYLLVISLLSSTHLFGAAQNNKNLAFDDLFDKTTRSLDVQTEVSEEINKDTFAKVLHAQANQIANLIYVNIQAGTLDNTDAPEFTVGGQKRGRIDSFEKVKESYKEAFNKFKMACGAFMSNPLQGGGKALVESYLKDVTTGNVKDRLMNKYKDVKHTPVDKDTIVPFIELITLHALVPEEIEKEIVHRVINEKFSGSRHAALKDNFIQSFFTDITKKENTMNDFWETQVEEDKENIQITSKKSNVMAEQIKELMQKPININALDQEIKNTAKIIAGVVHLNALLLASTMGNDKKALGESIPIKLVQKGLQQNLQLEIIKPLQERTKGIINELRTRLSNDKDAALSFIQALTGKTEKTIQNNLNIYFKDVQEATTKTTANVDDSALLAQLYFIADNVPEVTLAMIKPKDKSRLKLADTQYGLKMRLLFFEKHVTIWDNIKGNPIKSRAIGSAGIAALAAVVAGGVAYYKGGNTGLGTWKTMKKWFGVLNAQDKAEIATAFTDNKIKELFDKNTAAEILEMQAVLPLSSQHK